MSLFTLSDEQRAWREGYTACALGKSKRANPYNEIGFADAWERGFKRSERDEQIATDET